MNKLGAIAATAMILAAPAAQAATQCFPGPGTYGAVTVAVSGAGCVQNFNYGGVQSLVISGNASCVLTFSHALAASSFTIDLGNVDAGEVTTIATDAGPYAVQAADLTSPSTVYPADVGTLTASAGTIVSAPGPLAGGGASPS